MAPDTKTAPKPNGKEDSQGSKKASQRPQEQPLKCPRCDSANTKFCYYNNYSLTQPRHFCKTCRRYWTKGGALRNVPIGGGCRKNKKMKSSSSSKLCVDSRDSSGTSSDIGGLKFFHGVSPAMDFQLGGLNLSSPFSSFGGISSNTGAIASNPSCFTLDHHQMGFNFALPSLLKQDGNNNNNTTSTFCGGVQEMGHSSNIASSIESLSCINQDLHWKLQQQRFAMLFGAENHHKDQTSVSSSLPLGNLQIQKPGPILFQNLDISSKSEDNSRKESGLSGNLATEWFFDNSYAQVNPNPTNNNANDQNGSIWDNGVQTWSNLNQFSALP